MSRRLFPGGRERKECPCNWEIEFDPWVVNIPWGRKWQPTPVLLLGEDPQTMLDSPWGPRHASGSKQSMVICSSIHEIFQARKLEWVSLAIVGSKILRKTPGVGGLVAKSCSTLEIPWTARQAPLSIGFSRQEYWSGREKPLSKHKGILGQVTETSLIVYN